MDYGYPLLYIPKKIILSEIEHRVRAVIKNEQVHMTSKNMGERTLS